MLCLVVLGVGCQVEIAGTGDVELTYEVVRTSSPAATFLADRIRGRLASAQIVADVSLVSPTQARIILGAGQQKTAEALLRWEGGLSFFRPTDVSGGVIDPKAEPLFSIFDLASAQTAARGRSIRITFVPGTAFPKGASEMMLVAACDRAVLGTVNRHDLLKPLEFSLGSDLQAYARAAFLAHLLASPDVPPLRETAVRSLPPDWIAASLGLFLPLVISLSWLVFVRRFDRAHPEPSWLVLATFALGGVGVLVAAFVEGLIASLSQYLNPSLMSFGGQLWALPIAVIVFAICVGAVEEGVKLVAVLFLARRRIEFDEPVDGIVYGSAAALGFAAIENMKYFALGRLSPSVIVMRTLTSAPAHLFFGAIWGYALGVRLVSRRRRLPLYFAVAALAHGAFDAFLSSQGGAILVLPLELALATTFIVLLRRSLRHGAVRDDTIPASAMERLRLPLGSNVAFFVSAILMHLGALGVAFVGIYFEASRRRVDFPFFVAALSTLALFGLSAAGVSASLPLELVVDDQGVTFGGTARRWNEIDRIDRLGSKLALRCKNGADMLLGPGKDNELDMVEASIAERLATRG